MKRPYFLTLRVVVPLFVIALVVATCFLFPAIDDPITEVEFCGNDNFLIAKNRFGKKFSVYDVNFEKVFEYDCKHEGLAADTHLEAITTSKRLPFAVLTWSIGKHSPEHRFEHQLWRITSSTCNAVSLPVKTIRHLCDDFDADQTFIVLEDDQGKPLFLELKDNGSAIPFSPLFRPQFVSNMTAYSARIHSIIYDGDKESKEEATNGLFDCTLLPISAAFVGERYIDLNHVQLVAIEKRQSGRRESAIFPNIEHRGAKAVGYSRIFYLTGNRFFSWRVDSDGEINFEIRKANKIQ